MTKVIHYDAKIKGDTMTASEEKTRVIITITKKQKELLERLAKKDQRSISNFCSKVLSDYLETLKDGDVT